MIEINVVRQPSGSTVTLQVETSNTIEDVKLKLSEELNISQDEQELQYEQSVLQDNYTLLQCNVSNGSLLDLWLKQAGEKCVIYL